MKNVKEFTAILHSKRANIYYLEKTRILVKDGRVVYLTVNKNRNDYWNVPVANTTVILLGTGTSISNSAVRLLASAGVLIGFSGSDATPLFAGCEVEWISPQNEYRPTEYVQSWLSFWFNEEKRLQVAKKIQIARIEFIEKVWSTNRFLKGHNISLGNFNLENAINDFKGEIDSAFSVSKLLQIEATMTKRLYKEISRLSNNESFVRDRDAYDGANRFLNHGNYLAYGLAATVLWVLGIPHSFAVMHGKTRRGALVFDVADLIKDAIILPNAFIQSDLNVSDEEFRLTCVSLFVETHALDYMFNTVKEIACTKDFGG